MIFQLFSSICPGYSLRASLLAPSRSSMYGKISVILHFTDLCDKQKNFKRVYEKFGQRGFFLKCVKKLFSKKTPPKIDFLPNSVAREVKTQALTHEFFAFLKELLTKCAWFRRPNSKFHAGQIVFTYHLTSSPHIKIDRTRY